MIEDRELSAPKRNFLIGKSCQYNFRIAEGELPLDLAFLKNKIPWPISPNTRNVHLACYYNEINYSGGLRYGLHAGLDVQVKHKTPVFAPQNLKVVRCDPPDERGLTDLLLQNESSGLTYFFCHLDPLSIPVKIRENRYVNKNNPSLPCGSFIGKVGIWPYELGEQIPVPSDVLNIYRRRFHHLHIEMLYIPHPIGTKEFRYGLQERNLLNPLLLLENPR